MAVAAHAIRLFAQERSSGPRALAWVSGIFLLGLLLVSGWTGFVMVWDTFGTQLAVAGARIFDTLPVLSEPVARIFAGDRPVPPAFFFINLFLHVALPLGAAAGIWLHVSRIARPTLLPPRPLLTAMVVVLVVTAVVLGGVDIYGGRGSVVGVVLALLILGTLSNGMGLANIAGPTQTVVFGLLLIGSILLPRIVARLTAAIRARRPTADAALPASS